MPARRKRLFLGGRLLVERRLERRAGLETRVLGRGDLDLLARRGIAAFSGGAFADGKRSESDETNLLSLLQGLFDAAQHGVERFSGAYLGQSRFRRNVIDELKLVHSGLSVGTWPSVRRRFFARHCKAVRALDSAPPATASERR